LLVHIQKSPLRAELEKKLEFDKELTDKWIADLKQFIKTYILSIKDYDISKYGLESELNQVEAKKK
jgi:hypothetical protein